jgi:hypothetical protein
MTANGLPFGSGVFDRMKRHRIQPQPDHTTCPEVDPDCANTDNARTAGEFKLAAEQGTRTLGTVSALSRRSHRQGESRPGLVRLRSAPDLTKAHGPIWRIRFGTSQRVLTVNIVNDTGLASGEVAEWLKAAVC